MTELESIVNNMSTAHIQVKYDGSVVHDGGSMDARTFGSSLISLADAYGRAAQLLHPGENSPVFDIKATEPGSFLVDLIVTDPGWIKAIYDALNSDPAQASANAAELVGVVVSAVKLLKRIRGRRYDTTPAEDGQSFNVTITGDNNVFSVNQTVLNVAEDARFISDMRKFAKPVLGIGNSSVSLSGEDIESVTIEAEDDEVFTDVLGSEDEIETVEQPMVLTVAVLTLEGRGQWKFRWGGMPISARITDQAFLDRIDHGEQFSKGTRLHCLVRIQTNDTTGATKYTIIKVDGKSVPGQQMTAF